MLKYFNNNVIIIYSLFRNRNENRQVWLGINLGKYLNYLWIGILGMCSHVWQIYIDEISMPM